MVNIRNGAYYGRLISTSHVNVQRQRKQADIGKNEEFKEIHRYYTTREKNPLKKMQSLIVVACKLIRVFHAILTKGIRYDASKMLKDIRHPGEQLKAA